MIKVWKGTYGFSEEHGDVLADKIIQFELQITMEDGAFTGRFIDPEYESISEKEIKLTGFFEDDFVSFVVTYPYRKLYNQQGEAVLLLEKIDQEVTYYGEFIEGTKKIAGQWEILEQAYFDVDRVNVIYSHGNFEMEEFDS